MYMQNMFIHIQRVDYGIYIYRLYIDLMFVEDLYNTWQVTINMHHKS